MTKKYNELVTWTEDDTHKLIDLFQEILMRQVKSAYDAGEMEPSVYDDFITCFCTEKDRESVYAYYDEKFNRLLEYHRSRLQSRIVKGAEMLDEMSKEDPNYDRYMKHYDGLVEKMTKSYN